MVDNKFSVNLDERPREHIVAFLKEVKAVAANKCREYHISGLLYEVLTKEQWAAFPANRVTNADGDIIITPPPQIVKPDKKAAISTSKLEREFYAAEFKEYTDIITETASLRIKLLNSIPASAKEELSDPEYELLHVTCLDIMQYLHNKYGTLQQSDYSQLALQLQIKLDVPGDFSTHAVHMLKIFQKYSLNNQPKSELDKCTALKESIQHLVPCSKAIDAFYDEFSLINDQTFAKMVTFIEKRALNFPLTSSNMGYANAAIKASDIVGSAEFKTAVDAAVHAATQQFKKQDSRDTNSNGRGFGNMGRNNNNSRGHSNAGRGTNGYNNNNNANTHNNNNGRASEYEMRNHGNRNGGRTIGGRGDYYRGRNDSNNGTNSGLHYCFFHGSQANHPSFNCVHMCKNTNQFTLENRQAMDSSSGGNY